MQRVRVGDVPVQIELSRQAQAMLHEADERWSSEHGFDTENPLLAEVARAAELLRENPELGIAYRQNTFRRDVRRLLLRSGMRSGSAVWTCTCVASVMRALR